MNNTVRPRTQRLVWSQAIYSPVSDMKRVAVIGAGAAGLSALKSLSSHFDKLSFVAFEQSDRVGGTWIHNDKYKPTSMYDNLL